MHLSVSLVCSLMHWFISWTYNGESFQFQLFPAIKKTKNVFLKICKFKKNRFLGILQFLQICVSDVF